MASMQKINEQALSFFEELEAMEDEQKESFKIDNDNAAEWALERIRESTDDANRLLKIIAAKREELDLQEKQINDRLEGQTRYLKGLLEGYFRSGLKTKSTKTQDSYKLLSGTLIMKKPSWGYLKDEKAIIQALHDMGKEEYVETVEKLKWADFKKTLVFDNDTVYDPDTGMMIDGITAIQEPEHFEVKL